MSFFATRAITFIFLIIITCSFFTRTGYSAVPHCNEPCTNMDAVNVCGTLVCNFDADVPNTLEGGLCRDPRPTCRDNPTCLCASTRTVGECVQYSSGNQNSYPHNPALDGHYAKINCSGACPAPQIVGPCLSCGSGSREGYESGYVGSCAIQPDGSIFDSCCQGSTPERSGNSCTCVAGAAAFYELFNTIGSILLPVVVIIGMFIIVLKGYGIMSSQGDPAKLQESKEGLTSAIIGLIFVLMAVSILRVIIKALITGDTGLL